MANIKSQKKRILTNAKAAARNKAIKSELKTRVKNAVTAANATGTADPTIDEVKLAIKKIDKAASKGVIHANQAANKKSAMALAVNKL